MPETPVRSESPLARFRLGQGAHPPVDAPGISAWERPFLGHINLHGDAADPRFAAAVADVLGAALPPTPNTVSVARQAVAWWLGPDEWLLVTPPEREVALARSLREALGGLFSAVTEVGSGQTAIVLRGAAARELLARECPLDLGAPSFVPGACAQTRLAKAAVLLRPLPGDALEMIVRRSFADYVWTWLCDAGVEFGLRAIAAPAGDAPG